MNKKLIKLRYGYSDDIEERTIKNIAPKIGVSVSTLSRAEKGETIGRRSQCLIADFYSVSIAEIFKEVS